MLSLPQSIMDGFSMFDSKYTDFIKSPQKKLHSTQNPKANVTKEIFNSFQKKDFGAYFSKTRFGTLEYYWDPYFLLLIET